MRPHDYSRYPGRHANDHIDWTVLAVLAGLVVFWAVVVATAIALSHAG